MAESRRVDSKNRERWGRESWNTDGEEETGRFAPIHTRDTWNYRSSDRRISDRWIQRLSSRYAFPSLPASRHIYAHAYGRGNGRIIERRRSTWPGLCRSDERKEISNQIWEAQPGGSRIRLSDPCFRCFAGKHHFHDRRNDFLSKAKLYSYMENVYGDVFSVQGLFVYISARSCHVIVLSSTNKRE